MSATDLQAQLEIAFEEQDYGSFQTLLDELFLLFKERRPQSTIEDSDGSKAARKRSTTGDSNTSIQSDR